MRTNLLRLFIVAMLGLPALAHAQGTLSTQGFGYPAVLARADDRAVISLGDRGVLDTLVQQELARRGVVARPSAKLSRKQVRTV